MSDKCPLETAFESLKASDLTPMILREAADKLIEDECKRLEGEDVVGVKEMDLDVSKLYLANIINVPNPATYYPVKSAFAGYALMMYLANQQLDDSTVVSNAFFLMKYSDEEIEWIDWEGPECEEFDWFIYEYLGVGM